MPQGCVFGPNSEIQRACQRTERPMDGRERKMCRSYPDRHFGERSEPEIFKNLSLLNSRKKTLGNVFKGPERPRGCGVESRASWGGCRRGNIAFSPGKKRDVKMPLLPPPSSLRSIRKYYFDFERAERARKFFGIVGQKPPGNSLHWPGEAQNS